MGTSRFPSLRFAAQETALSETPHNDTMETLYRHTWLFSLFVVLLLGIGAIALEWWAHYIITSP